MSDRSQLNLFRTYFSCFLIPVLATEAKVKQPNRQHFAHKDNVDFGFELSLFFYTYSENQVKLILFTGFCRNWYRRLRGRIYSTFLFLKSQ